jgi:hypothetical protein
MRNVTSLLSVVALAGCATPASDDAALDGELDLSERHGRRDPDLTRSGSRLKAKEVKGPHGVRDTLGFTDTALGLDCNFERAKTGEFRCFPAELNWEYFLDSTCTDQPVQINYAEATQPAIGDVVAAFTFELANINERSVSAYEIVEEIPPAKIYWHALGLCEEQEPDPRYRHYTLRPIDSSRFVRGEPRLDRVGGDRIFAHTLHGSDGSRAHATVGTGNYYDAVLHQTVAPQVTRQSSVTDVEFVWAPTSPDPMWIDRSDRFSDARCTRPAAEVTLGEDFVMAPGSVIANEPTLEACRAYRTEFTKVESTPLDTAYVSDGATCTAGEPLDGAKYFKLGRKLRRHEYVTGRLRLEGRGRIAKHRVDNSDGSVAILGDLHDRELGRSCSLIYSYDGTVMHCEPFDGNDTFEAGSLGYLDPECTQPVIDAAFGLASEACFTGATHAYLRNEEDTASVTLFTGGARVTTPEAPVQLYFQNFRGGDCYPASVGQAYAVASEVNVPLAVFRLEGATIAKAARGASLAKGRGAVRRTEHGTTPTPRTEPAASRWAETQRGR